MMTVEFKELNSFGNKLRRVSSRMRTGMQELNRTTAVDAHATLVRHASGRPGPNVVTGQYIRSWSVKYTSMYSFSLETDAPQAHRLEYGFYGTDSAGRVYHQGPFPHINPTMVEVTERYKVNLKRLFNDTWRSS